MKEYKTTIEYLAHRAQELERQLGQAHQAHDALCDRADQLSANVALKDFLTVRDWLTSGDPIPTRIEWER